MRKAEVNHQTQAAPAVEDHLDERRSGDRRTAKRRAGDSGETLPRMPEASYVRDWPRAFASDLAGEIRRLREESAAAMQDLERSTSVSTPTLKPYFRPPRLFG